MPTPDLYRSKGKNPMMDGPSDRTATRAFGRNSPAMIVNSGERNGLANGEALDCMERHESMSAELSSPGRTTRIIKSFILLFETQAMFTLISC
jgi:hypothetical protein